MSIVRDHFRDRTPCACASGDSSPLLGLLASLAALLLVSVLVWVALDASPSNPAPCRDSTVPVLLLTKSDFAALSCTSDLCRAQLFWRLRPSQIAAER